MCHSSSYCRGNYSYKRIVERKRIGSNVTVLMSDTLTDCTMLGLVRVETYEITGLDDEKLRQKACSRGWS